MFIHISKNEIYDCGITEGYYKGVKERYVIEKRYFNNKTQSELATELGVSQAQISRMEKNALDRMKKRVEKGI